MVIWKKLHVVGQILLTQLSMAVVWIQYGFLNVQVRIDHRTGSLHFGTDLCFSHDLTPEGPQIQSMPSDKFRNQLMLMARALDKANLIICPKELQVT